MEARGGNEPGGLSAQAEQRGVPSGWSLMPVSGRGPDIIVPPPSSTPVSTIALLVVAGVAVFTGIFTLAGIPAVIFGVVALVRSRRDPVAAARLTRIGWFVFTIPAILLAVAGLVALLVLVVLAA